MATPRETVERIRALIEHADERLTSARLYLNTDNRTKMHHHLGQCITALQEARGALRPEAELPEFPA